MKVLSTKLLMFVLMVFLVACSDEMENINPSELETKSNLSLKQKSEREIRQIINITDSISKRYERKVAGLSKEEREQYVKHISELTNGHTDNLDELVKAMGFKSINEYESVLNSLKFHINLLEKNNPDFKNMDYHQKLKLFSAYREAEVSTMGTNCAGEYYSCKTSADNTFTVAAVGCVVAGAGTLITAGCLFVVDSMHDSELLECRYDYMVCTI